MASGARDLARPVLLVAVSLLAPPGLAHAQAAETGTAVQEEAQGQAEHAPGEILIKFRPDVRAAQQGEVRAEFHAVRRRRFRSGAEHWRLGPGVTTEQAIARLRHHPYVQYVEPNYIVQALRLPDDPRFFDLWGLLNFGQTGGTYGADIDAESAWNVTTGSRTVLVGVIDSGIDYTHPDLSANIYANAGELPDNGVDDDQNGFVDDIRGWDFLQNDNDPMDDRGHGTHVAGTIGAVGNNGVGVTGVSWEVTLVPLKFISASGLGTTADAAEAVDYATRVGVDIINASWGGAGFSQTLLEAIVEATEAGILFVSAAGNKGSDADLEPHYPSGYDVPGIVSVAATDDNDLLASFSNYGAMTVDLAAPGVSTLSTVPFGDYDRLSGTSMAAPHVAGAAALIRALAPRIPVLPLKQKLLESVDVVPELAGRTVSGGRLNAFRSLSSRETNPPGACADLTVSSPESFSLTLTWTATGDDGDTGTASLYEIRYSTSPFDEAGFASAARVTGPPPPLAAGNHESLVVRGLASSTTYFFALKAIDDWGNAGPMSSLASGSTLEPPDIGVVPESLSVDLFSGLVATRTLTIENTGAGDLAFDLTVRAPAADSWLAADPRSGTLPPGGTLDVLVSFNAAGLAGGDYNADLVVSSNDPDELEVVVPARMHVTSAPEISLSSTSLDFGSVIVGATRSLTLTVGNDGYDILTAGLATDHADFSVDATSLSIPAGGSRDVVLTFHPSLPALLQGTLTLQTNDPDEGTVTVFLRGTGLVPPDIAVFPAALDAGLFAGQTTTRALTLQNAGGSDLHFRTGVRLGPPPGGAAGADAGRMPGATVLIIQSVRPWDTSSNEQVLSANGLVYDTIEPSQLAATNLSAYRLVIVPSDQTPSYYSILAGEADRLSAYVALGGVLEFHAASHGLAGGDSSSVALPGGMRVRTSFSRTNRVLKPDHPLTIGVPDPMISETSTSHCGFYGIPADAERVARDETVQSTLVVYRFGRGTVVAGCQTLEIGLSLGEHAGIVLRNLIPYAYGLVPDWLSVNPVTGTVPAGGSVEVTVRFDATDRVGGAYDAGVLIASNDPDEPEVEIPTHLHVTGLPDVRLSTNVLHFGDRSVGTATAMFLTVSNDGNDVLTASLESDSGQFSATPSTFAVPAGDRRTVTVTFSPSRSGPLTGVLTLRCNDPDEGEVSVSLSGAGLLRPSIEITPSSFEWSLFRGETGARTLGLRNAGTADLTFSMTVGASDWLSASPHSGTVPPGANLEVLVHVDAQGLNPTAHLAVLRVASNDPDRSDLGILVTLRVLPDADGDRIVDSGDNCLFVPNPLQEDSDQDGSGDGCDNCPTTTNRAQGDRDQDGHGDACDSCPGIANSGQEDSDGDLQGDLCDNCPSVANPDQEDGNHDGSGDACQPELLLRSILQDGGDTLEVRAEARDPQGDSLSGRMEILGWQQEVVLQDIGYKRECGLGFPVHGEAGEGITFAFGSVGMPLLFDLDSTFGCSDAAPDFLLAHGRCDNPLGAFETVLSLASMTPPASICLRDVDAPEGGVDVAVLRYDQDSIALLIQSVSILEVNFTDRLPRQATLGGLRGGMPYWLEITLTDGSTAPVRAEAQFLYQGEARVVINNPPRAAPSAPGVAECDRHGGALLILDGTASQDPDSTPGTQDDLVEFAWLRDPGLPTEQFLGAGPVLAAILPLGTHEVGLRLTDAMGESDTVTVHVTVVDTTPPVLACPAQVTTECAGPDGAHAALVSTASDICDPSPRIANDRTPNGGDGSGLYPQGTTPVGFTAEDASGNIATCGTGVTVQDTTPPGIEVTAGPAMLWPPNHMMRAVRISWKADDLCDPGPSVVLLEASSSEPDDAPGGGDGQTLIDISGADLQTPDIELLLRAERSEGGPGRTYRLVYQAVDGSGNAGAATALVEVPHDLGGLIEPMTLHVEQESVEGQANIPDSCEGGCPQPSHDVGVASLAELGIVQGIFLLFAHSIPVISGTFADRFGFK